MSGNDASASALASVPTSGMGSTSKVDADQVAAHAVQPPASPTPSVLSTATIATAAAVVPPSIGSTAATAAMSSSAVATAQDPPVSPGTAPTPAGVVSGTASTLLSAVLSPLAKNAPTPPVEPPTMWTLLAFARREFERTVNPSPTNPLAGHIENGLVTETLTLNGQSIDPVATGNIGAPTPGLSDLTANPQPTASAAEDPWMGEPSFLHEFAVGALRVIGAVGKLFGAQSALSFAAPLLASDSPPWFTTLGLNVQRSEFEGMPVWTLQSPMSSSGNYVVGLHGGGYVLKPVIWHWLDYGAMARDTGATVIVPIYPLAPQGTAATVVPQIADLIASQIDQHGAENVSVYGDSAGGGLALAAVQELVRRGDPVPSHMVLISPELDVTLSDPASHTIDDLYLNASEVQAWGRLWAGDLDPADPRVSPLFGSLSGLPPTAVYSGSLDLLSPDTLRLRERALAEGADMTFVLRKGLIHDWAALPILLPEAAAVRPDIYQQLGIGPEARGPHLPVNRRSCPRSSKRAFACCVRSRISRPCSVWIPRPRYHNC